MSLGIELTASYGRHYTPKPRACQRQVVLSTILPRGIFWRGDPVKAFGPGQHTLSATAIPGYQATVLPYLDDLIFDLALSLYPVTFSEHSGTPWLIELVPLPQRLYYHVCSWRANPRLAFLRFKPISYKIFPGFYVFFTDKPLFLCYTEATM